LLQRIDLKITKGRKELVEGWPNSSQYQRKWQSSEWANALDAEVGASVEQAASRGIHSFECHGRN